MRKQSTLFQTGAYALAIVCLIPLAVYLESLWGWTPGGAALVLLAIPTVLSALSGHRSHALLVAVIASVGCFAGAFFVTGRVPADSPYVFPLLASCVLLAQSGLISTIVESLNQRVRQLEEQNTSYVRALYQRSRDEEQMRPRDRASEHGSPEAAESKNGAAVETVDRLDVNYPMLLLALQDIGRRVSTNLSLETLVPTIVSTAKASLKCGECQVYFWNAQTNTLKNAFPSRGRQSSRYVPRPNIGMSRWVLENRQILTRETVETDYALRGLLEEDPEMPDAIAPLAVGGELLGLLVVNEIEQDTATFVRLLYVHANIYALGIKNAQLFARIEEMARRDGLTGLFNHASFQQEAQRLVEEASGSSAPLTVVMSDVDHFKKFNDTYGHQAGDHVLREVARLWKSTVPENAILARYGGEEFICALPDEGREQGRTLAEMLRESIETYPLSFEGQPLQVTASFGVAELGGSIQTPADLIRVADEALYRAKETGRNRVVCHCESAKELAQKAE